jgi:hypothetical protein
MNTMNTRERIAWSLVLIFALATAGLWWRVRARYEFIAAVSPGVWRLDPQSGEAWIAFSGSQNWKRIGEPSTARANWFGTTTTTNRPDVFDEVFADLTPTNHNSASTTPPFPK